MVKAVIKKANPQSAAGPSGLRYSHLQAALCDELVEDLAMFATLVFSSHVLPQVFWTLHTSANVSALGKRRDQWRAVMSCGKLLALLLPALEPVRRSTFKRSRDNGFHSNTEFRRVLHLSHTTEQTP